MPTVVSIGTVVADVIDNAGDVVGTIVVKVSLLETINNLSIISFYT